MTFIDTHCHLYDEAFDADRAEAVQRALDAGVTTLLLPDIDSSSTPRLDALQAAYPSHFRSMAGLHPTSVKDDYEQELQHVHSRLFHSSNSGNSPLHFIAVGEIGLDFYWDRTYEAQQVDALRRQLLWAAELDLPVCLHIRKAHNEVFALLRELNRPSWRGVMHCFGGSVQEAQRAVEMGFHLGIGGVVTFKNATMADVAKAMPLESLLLETDAPYLSPVPHRGQRNESAYIPLIAQRIADLRDIPLQQVADVTTASARTLFNL
ncbi:MAG: TatD family hydrolase [Bacteroidales bacterium]|nr:TatD family hydrolase [Bacteroidales bacterium]